MKRFLVSALAISSLLNLRPEAADYSGISQSLRLLCVSLSAQKANAYSFIIQKYANKYGLPWKIMATIFKQESECGKYLRNGCEKGYAKVNGEWQLVESCQDFGMVHFNRRMVQEYKLNIDKLDTDADYALGWMAKHLYRIYKSNKDDIIWYCRYNSNTKEKKYEYCGHIHRHMEVLKVGGVK
jgi:hypothetical protein